MIIKGVLGRSALLAAACLGLLIALLGGCGDSGVVGADQGSGGDALAPDGSGKDGQAADRGLPSVDARPGQLEAGTADASAEGGNLPTFECDSAKVDCLSAPEPCGGLGEARVVVGGCWGECVPIEQCSDLPAQPDCDTTNVACDLAINCRTHYVPTYDGQGCYGPCVPATACACSQGGPPNQCPGAAGGEVCWSDRGRCGPAL